MKGCILVDAVFNAIYTFWNQIVYAISSMRFPFDFIDILVISYIIYKTIGFLRETRAGQLVKGIIILLLIYLVADWFNLVSIQWLFSKLANSVLIVVCVIFQPELRRSLERVGRTKFGKSQGNGEYGDSLSRCIDDVTKAISQMQKEKIGALIVFERTTQLGEIINTGTLIEASSSVAMINNIFFPKSPLHDGALIIRDGKLYAAGCILPLTAREDLSTKLGTRHRAAIGMTENSDAVVLVVSEETGTISIAYNGQMVREFNSVSAGAELRKQLLKKEVVSEKGFITVLKNLNIFNSKKGAEDNDKTVK